MATRSLDELKEGDLVGMTPASLAVVGAYLPPATDFLLLEMKQEQYKQHHVSVSAHSAKGWMPGYSFLVKDGTMPFESDIAEETRQTLLAELAINSAKFVGASLTQSKLGPYVGMGCDPEIFVTHGDGSLFPAFEFLPPKPSAPKESIPLFWDGYQAEFCPRAFNCLAWLMDDVRTGLMNTLFEARKKDPTAKLSLKSVFPLSPEELATREEKYINLGCSPSKNAYGERPLSIDPRTLPWRMAGGHIHFGLPTESGYTKRDYPLTSAGRVSRLPEVVKFLDATLGVISVSLFQGLEDPLRRNFYGRPGEYRMPPHGLEYRVLSNAWLTHPAIAHLTYELGRAFIRMAHLSPIYRDAWKYDEDEVRSIILDLDVKGAQKVMERNSAVLEGFRGTLEHTVTLKKTLYEGAISIVRDPQDIEKNWELNGHWQTHSDNNEAGWVANRHGRKI